MTTYRHAAAALAAVLLVVLAAPSPAAAVAPEGGAAEAFARLQQRLDAAPGVAWSIESDLVVPALPDIDHILDALVVPELPAGAGTYPSLAAALLGVEAARTGSSLDQLVGTNLDSVASMTGLSPFALAKLDLSSVGTFDAGLRSLGAPSLGSLDDLVARLGGPASGVDEASALSASSFARSLWQLNMPQMPSAPMPQVDLAAAGFGLLTNRALSAFATDFPDLFASVSETGLGSDEHRQAWSSSMLQAYQSSQQDLNAALPSSCLAGMMAVAASGTPTSALAFDSCGADCQAAGMYLNNQMLGLWQPSAFSNQPVDDGVLSQSELSRLPGWLSDGIAVQMPAPTTSSTLQGSLQGACATADPATGAVRRVLPGVFDQLGR